MNDTDRRHKQADTSADSVTTTEARPRRGRAARQTGPKNAEEQQTGPAQEAPGQARPGLADLPISWSFRGFLVTYILLLLSVQRAHGYFIEQYLRGLGLLNVELSSLYRTLRQLESAGLVYSTWEHGPEGPARRVYSLTEAGRWWLDANASVLEGYRALIDRFFGTYSRANRSPNKTD